ncbi:MAG: amino acid ABC transporter permease [Candidatus Dormibacteria bacterium]
MHALVGGFDFSVFKADLFGTDFIVPGIRTLLITLAAQVSGIALGFLLALLRRSKLAVVRAPASAYVFFFRGTPILVQIVLVFDGLDELTGSSVLVHPITRNAIVAGILALALNEAAYMAEIIRAGLLSIEKGQFEAARSLGMTGGLAMRRIIMPQALRVIIPPTGNEFISMLKTTSLLEIIAVPELFTVASQHYSYDLKYFEPLLTISIWYIGFTFLFSRVQAVIERRLNAGYAEIALPQQARMLNRLLGSGLSKGSR